VPYELIDHGLASGDWVQLLGCPDDPEYLDVYGLGDGRIRDLDGHPYAEVVKIDEDTDDYITYGYLKL
jgi:hypothetical protein